MAQRRTDLSKKRRQSHPRFYFDYDGLIELARKKRGSAARAMEDAGNVKAGIYYARDNFEIPLSQPVFLLIKELNLSARQVAKLFVPKSDDDNE